MPFPLLQRVLLVLCLLCCGAAIPAWGYSVLTHLAIIDATWDQSIRPLLKEKYPGATDSELQAAHAFAYGGCVAPDMGYFPRGSKMFTNLFHYVRSGDFINALLDESTNVEEYAFALGTLAHYNADKYGHRMGTNLCTPMIFPKSRKKFGDTVTYEEDPTAHIRTEFSFDVLQTARGNYASSAYHDFIGFQVAEALMQRAFRKTYGLELGDLYKDFDRSVNTFRWTVRSLFPLLTRTAWSSKVFRLRRVGKPLNRRSYVYRMRRREYTKMYGSKRDKPGVAASCVAVIVRVLPKIGPLKKLKIVVPGPVPEKIYLNSFDTVVFHYTASLRDMHARRPAFKDIDFDTGEETQPGEYQLADDSYGDLLLKLKEKNFSNMPPQLRQNILHFYAELMKTPVLSHDNARAAELSLALKQLKSIP